MNLKVILFSYNRANGSVLMLHRLSCCCLWQWQGRVAAWGLFLPQSAVGPWDGPALCYRVVWWVRDRLKVDLRWLSCSGITLTRLFNYFFCLILMTEFNILTCNVNGLNGPHRRTSFLELFQRKKVDIALIQESHLRMEDVRRCYNTFFEVVSFTATDKKTKRCINNC